jgi:NOL1/NOP2/fmu family ribosome biogenesis protein
VRFLNSKQKKGFFQQLSELYGYDGPSDFVIFEGGKNKFYVISADLAKLDLAKTPISYGGLYVANDSGGDLRLTMDGAMFFGPYCTGCFVDLDKQQLDDWMRGLEIDSDLVQAQYVIARYNTMIIGCGHAANNSIKPYISKGRRISDPH